jgi:hypothetical protein
MTKERTKSPPRDFNPSGQPLLRLAVTKGPRKRRTRDHVIADLSFNYLERAVLECGWTCDSYRADYGIDAVIRTYSPQGEIENGSILVQLKAKHALKTTRTRLSRRSTSYAFDADARDIRTWVESIEPVILVLFDARTRESYWLHVQAAAPKVSPRASSVRVHIPRANRLDAKAILKFQHLRNEAYTLIYAAQ